MVYNEGPVFTSEGVQTLDEDTGCTGKTWPGDETTGLHAFTGVTRSFSIRH